ncbi:LysM peptidoglycan-binding domain-containing protein [Pasteuria penetrans]|uniref:LysM peptidoglycan-binding domain-containing protein n=1 Tax=Pasteuria penetrans TaxID=86005 RepID=UPI000FBE8D31|nr:LysM domain-containing protein [Pasteuria penetrans]
MKIHIARAGDRLADLIRKYKIGQEQLLSANPHLNLHGSLSAGTKVRIPTGRIPVATIERGGVGTPPPVVEPSPQPPMGSQHTGEEGGWQVGDLPQVGSNASFSVVSSFSSAAQVHEGDPSLMVAEEGWLSEQEQVLPEDVSPVLHPPGNPFPLSMAPAPWGGGIQSLVPPLPPVPFSQLSPLLVGSSPCPSEGLGVPPSNHQGKLV